MSETPRTPSEPRPFELPLSEQPPPAPSAPQPRVPDAADPPSEPTEPTQPTEQTEPTDPTTDPHPTGTRRPWALIAGAALAGALVGIAGTVAVVALLSDDEPADVEQACAIVAGYDDDAFTGDAGEAFEDPADIYRAVAAASLFSAANDGEFEGELGDIAQGLQAGPQTYNPEAAKRGLDDARAYCDER